MFLPWYYFFVRGVGCNVGFLQLFAINLLKHTTYGDYALYYCRIYSHLEKPFYKNIIYCSTAVTITTYVNIKIHIQI